VTRSKKQKLAALECARAEPKPIPKKGVLSYTEAYIDEQFYIDFTKRRTDSDS
jgi:hypothetical protein